VITGEIDPTDPRAPWGHLYWMGYKAGRDPGARFEVAGTIAFHHEGLVSGTENGGLIIVPADLRVRGKMLPIGISRTQTAGFLTKEGLKRVEVGETAEFRVVFEDRTLTLFVNEKQVGEPHQLADDWKGNLTFALSTYGNTPTQFKNLRIRKLGQEAEK
jgi:hypothetical protein